MSSVQIGELFEYVIGGGWGNESASENSVPVAVIRGADFPEVMERRVDGLPRRFEERGAVAKRTLRPGDLVLEISGGTRERPTGRSVFVTESMLCDADDVLIPASFCRLLRPNSAEVDPAWLFYFMQNWWNGGGAWSYQNQSTGIANFRFKVFANQVLVDRPHRGIQEGVSEILGALDDKIAANRHIVDAVDDSIRAYVAARLAEPSRLWGALDIVFGEAFKGESFSAPGTGRALVRIRDLKSQKCQVWTTERRLKELEVRPGDVLVGMDAEFRATRWSGPTGVLNQRVLAASSDKYGPAIAREMLVAPLRRIERGKSGTTVIHLNKSDLISEGVLAPVDSEVPALRALVDPMWDRAVAAEQESVRLAATRDELLPLLMSGKITVKDAEKSVEEVV